MDFQEVLGGYEAIVSWYKNRINKAIENNDEKLVEELELRLSTTVYNFNRMLDFITDKDEIYSRRECTPKEIKKYQKELAVEGDLIGMLDYRGISCPIFFDDYGQQEYIEVHRKGRDVYTIPGGAYNFDPELDWVAQINILLDLED